MKPVVIKRDGVMLAAAEYVYDRCPIEPLKPKAKDVVIMTHAAMWMLGRSSFSTVANRPGRAGYSDHKKDAVIHDWCTSHTPASKIAIAHKVGAHTVARWCKDKERPLLITQHPPATDTSLVTAQDLKDINTHLIPVDDFVQDALDEDNARP